jgi:hypothetical protein
MRQWDKGTMGPRDNGTKGQRDKGTKGQRDKGTTEIKIIKNKIMIKIKFNS